MSKDWLTLRQCAEDAKVSVELVRQWCVNHEQGNEPALPSSHFGSEPADKAMRLNRRVHAEDWSAFQRKRRATHARHEQLIQKRAATPPQDFPPRRRALIAAGGFGQNGPTKGAEAPERLG